MRSRVQSSLTAPFNIAESESYGEPESGRYDNSRAFTGTNADKSGLPRTNPVQPTPICSHDVPQTNENPGALAGASGAIEKTYHLQIQGYADAPDAARRIDRNGNWKLTRNDWKRSIRRDVSLSYPARMVAWSLCDDYANHETGFCNPKVETLAHASGVSLRACQRALAELRAAGLISIEYAEGRGDRSEISFMSGLGKHALKASERVTYMASRDTENVPEVAPIRLETLAYPKPKVVPLHHHARLAGRAGRGGRCAGQ